jgi:hypothetical protein
VKAKREAASVKGGAGTKLKWIVAAVGVAAVGVVVTLRRLTSAKA